MKEAILILTAAAARALPMPLKRALYRFDPVARLIRGSLNRAAPTGPTEVNIAAGGLQGYRMILDLQSEKDYWLGTYEPELQSAIEALVKPGAVVYDVGANIGYLTLLFAKMVGEEGKVYAFEALPANVQRLKANVAVNTLTARIKVEPCAVVEKDGPVNFLTGPSGGVGKVSGSAGRAQLVYHQAMTVPGISLDSFVYKRGNPAPQVIKVDIEGGEVLALPGMAALLSRDRPLLLLELHGTEATQVVWKTLKSVDYEIHWMQPGYRQVNDFEELDWKAYLLAKPS